MGTLLSAHQAAERLGVSIWTVARLARAGKLGSVLIGRRRLFAEEDLEHFVTKSRIGSQKEGGGALAKETTPLELR